MTESLLQTWSVLKKRKIASYLAPLIHCAQHATPSLKATTFPFIFFTSQEDPNFVIHSTTFITYF